jgi:hypothetical protein
VSDSQNFPAAPEDDEKPHGDKLKTPDDSISGGSRGTDDVNGDTGVGIGAGEESTFEPEEDA